MKRYFDSIVNKFDTQAAGNAGAGRTVTVRTVNGELAQLFIDDGVTPTTNPVRADNDGNYFFYIDDGIYNIIIDEGLPTKVEFNDVQIFDIADSNIVSNTFVSVESMKTQPLNAGALVETRSYYNASATDTKGGAKYFVVTASNYPGAPDGFSDHVLANGNIAVLITNNLLSATQFGATGSGGTGAVVDDTAAIQALVNKATSTSLLNTFPVYFEKGLYEIQQPIVVPESLRFVMYSDGRSGGARIQVSTANVPENTPITAMFQFTTPTAIQVYNIAVWGNNRATTIFDLMQDQQGQGIGGRTCLFDYVQMHGVRQGGSAINGISFSSSVTNCDIAGFGDANSPTTWQGNGILIAQASNGVNIKNNYIRRLDIGITNTASGSNDLVNIEGNIFDNLKLCGVYTFRATRVLNIKNNYWEAVVEENSAGVDAPISTGTENISSVICCATPPSDSVQGITQSLNISGNNFIAGRSDSIIAVSGIFKGNFTGNNVRFRQGDTTAQHDEFVKVFGYGTFTSSRFQRSILCDGNDLWKERSPTFEPAVQRIINFSTDLTATNGRFFEGVVIKDSIARETYNLTSLFDSSFLTLNDVNSRYTTVWDTATKDIIRVVKNVGGTVVGIDLTQHLEKVRGTYVRVEMESLSDTEGIRPELRFDDGVNVTRVVGGDGDVAASTYDYTDFPLYIDENATTLDVEYSTLGSDGSIMKFRNINIVPIYMDSRAGTVSNEVAQRTQPTIGFWQRGDFVRNRLYDAGEAYGWACTGSGEGGTWEPIAALSSNLNDEIPKQVFGNYTLLAGDRGRTIKCASDSAPSSVTIGLDNSMITNGNLNIIQTGNEAAVITAAAGVTLNEVDGGSVTLSGKFSAGNLTKIGDNNWQWIGDGDVS